MKQKFNVGDKVVIKGDPQKEVHEVLGFSFDKEFIYKISSKEVDVVKKEIVNGVSSHRGTELEGVKK